MSNGDSALGGIGSIPAYDAAASLAQAANVTQARWSASPAGGAGTNAVAASAVGGPTAAPSTDRTGSGGMTGGIAAPARGSSVIASAPLLEALDAIPSQHAAQALELLRVGVRTSPAELATAAASSTSDRAKNPITDTF